MNTCEHCGSPIVHHGGIDQHTCEQCHIDGHAGPAEDCEICQEER